MSGFIKVYNVELGREENWTIAEVLNEINRDHSDEWVAYTEDDWREGWNEWVEGEVFKLVEENA